MLFVKQFALRMKGVMLCADSGGVCLERDEMRFQLLEVHLMTCRAELRTMELFKLLHEFGVRRLKCLLRRDKINRRFGCLGHSLHLTRLRPARLGKTRRTEERAIVGILETSDRVRTSCTSRTSTRAKR